MSGRLVWGLLLLACAAVFGGVVAAGVLDLGRGPGYEFRALQPGSEDEPVAWSPCLEITYRVDTTWAPGGTEGAESYVALVDDAVAEVAGLTGLRFRRIGADRAIVHIVWAREADSEGLAGQVVGTARSGAQQIDGHAWYVAGRVTLETEEFERLAGLPDGEREGRAIILHELGHLVGLDHVDRVDQLMYSSVRRLDFGPGDREGLALLGRGRCMPWEEPREESPES